MTMTNDQIQTSYAGTLIIQYNNPASRAYQTIYNIVGEIIMNQLATSVMNGFEISTAVGVQLDIIGKYIGISRNGYTFTGSVTLTDIQYRQALLIKIAQNNLGSSLSDIQNFLHTFFDGQIFVFDYTTMNMAFYIDTSFGDPTLAEFFVEQNLLPVPMAIGYSVFYGIPPNNFFGFRTTTFVPDNKSFNNTLTFNPNWKFLTTQDTL